MPQSVPVLMYHSLEENSAHHSSPNILKSTTISFGAFQSQMEILRRLGYETIDLDQLLLNGKETSPKKCIITFDDGFYSTFKDAAPVLKAYNFTAVLFLPTGPVGKPDFDQFPGFKEITKDRPLTWDEVRRLRDLGWSIQSHGVNHPRMSGLTKEGIYKELHESKLKIEEETGTAVNYFAYPFGDYDTRVLRAIRQCGYKAAFSVHPGRTTAKGNLFRLRRIEVNSLDNETTFSNKIRTGYISQKEKYRSAVRDLLYANTYVKDLLRSLK